MSDEDNPYNPNPEDKHYIKCVWYIEKPFNFLFIFILFIYLFLFYNLCISNGRASTGTIKELLTCYLFNQMEASLWFFVFPYFLK